MANFGDFSDGGAMEADDYLVGYAAGGGAGSDRRWKVSNAIREKLTADTTYYVRSDGSNSNTGLTNNSGGAFLTITHAVSIVVSLDLNGHFVTIQIADGTYNSANIELFALTGSGACHIKGNETTPSNVVLNFAADSGFYAGDDNQPFQWEVSGVKTSNSAGSAFDVDGGWIWTHEINYGTCSVNHVNVHNGGIYYNNGSATISGGAQRHWSSQSQGLIRHRACIFTITGTPAFSTVFAEALGGDMQVDGNTFNGAATGKRFTVDYGGRMQLGTDDLNYFPGNSAGTISGGFYNNVRGDAGSVCTISDAVYNEQIISAPAVSGGVYLADVFGPTDSDVHYGYLRLRINDATGGSEDATWHFGSVTAGTHADTLVFSQTSVSFGASAFPNFVNDAAAAGGGVAVGQLYRNGSVLMVRVA